MKKRRLLAIVLTLVMVLSLVPAQLFGSTVYAASGDVPDHDKILTVNDDGTYTIALNVTGDSEKQITKVNVIVIVDRSNSMDTQSGTGAYVPSNQNGTNMYGLVDGEYVALTRTDNGYWANPRYTYSYTIDGVTTQYTGQRYQYDATADRMQATKAAVDSLASTLLGYNGRDDNPSDTVEMALVVFATAARTLVDETTDVTTYVNAVNGIATPGGNAGGTNWEMALREADGIDFGDTDPTYVIFFSDGAPTFYGTGPSGTGGETEPNMAESYNASTDEAAALATKVGTDNFYTIFAYGSDAGQVYMANLTTAAGAPAANNYSASNTAELNDAFAAILESIEMAGIGAVSMQDGTTSSVTTTTGEISNLLTVDENSYKYYRAGGDYSDIDDYDAEAGEYGAEWTGAPTATFENGAVKWDLSSEGVLENEVTYTVTFDCWPSQTTLDIAADIKNNPSSYDSLDANIKKYINSDGSLKTNTTASISYTDTRTGESNSKDYDNPDPVATSAIEQLAVSKEWENALDGQQAEPITLTVTRDGEAKYTLTLGNPEDPENPDSPRVWTDNVYISIGILRHTDSGTATDSAGAKYDILETGHDFTFKEPKDLGYYWELEVPTVRPMLVDGTVTMLILKEAKAPFNNPDNTTEYTIGGKTYYTGDTGEASLTAVNHRRARLNLTKVVDGEDADPNQAFQFTLNVVNSKASEGSADDLNSDYYVWFSVYNGGYVDSLVSGATKEFDDETGEWTGYYYAPSGSNIVVNLKKGDNLRFLNLPTGSTYTFTEGTLPTNYAFTSAKLTSGDDSTFRGAQTSTGTIVETETDYTVTYTNTYGLTDIEITKVWEDADDYDEIRPTADEFKEKLALKADGTDVTSSNASKLTVEADPDDANKYIVKWTGLDRYASGEEIAYTVEEATIDGYTTTGSPAEDHGTITNKHTPPAKAQIPVVKNVTPSGSGAADITGKFTFTLTAGTNTAGEGVVTPMPSSNTVLCGADGAEVMFGEITFTVPGTYTYTVTESVTGDDTATSKDGITLDSNKPRTYTVVVSEDETTGKLSAVVNGDSPVVFNNPYQVTSLDITIPVEKILDVPTGLTGPDITEAYTFTIATTNNAPLPETKTIKNPGAAGGSMTFGEEATTGKITVTAPGTYTYTITESGTVAGVTNDTQATKTVTVTVVNNGDGTMSYTINDADDENDDVTKFTNTYSADPVNASFPVQKVLTIPEGSEDAPAEWEYTFSVTAGEGAPTATSMSGTVTQANDTATFGPFTFNAPGTYTYTVTESGTVEGVVNDANATTGKTVTVVIEDGKEGKLVVKSISSTADSPLQFTNTYHETAITIPVTKTLAKDPANLTGPDITGQYTFAITGSTGAPLPETTSVTNNGGAMQFGPITFNEPGEYTYTVTESGTVAGVTNDPDDKSVTVTVTRNEETGELTAAFAEDSKTSFDFVNTYKVKPITASFPVKKVMRVPAGLTGPKTWSYTIDVAANGTAPVAETMTGTVTNSNDTVTFGDFTFTEPGTYTYTVTETGSFNGVTNDAAAEEGKTVQIIVTDNKDGTLTATPSSTADNPLTFTNSYSATSITATIQVHKDLVAENPKVSLPDITEKYTFTLADDTSDDVDSPLPETKEVKNPAKDGGTVPFGTITYEAPGTYTYVVTESGTVTNVTNDPEATTGKKVTVEVVDGGEGKLVATVKYPDAEKAEVDFTNTYKAPPVEASFPVQKIVSVPDGLTGPSEWSYTIDVAANGTAPAAKTMTGTVTNSKDTVTFGPFSFTEPGEFTYTVKETGTVKGVTNDKEAAGKTVTVKVIDNGDGTLTATPSVSDESPLQFTNTYSVEPTTASFPVKKVIDVPEGLTGPKTWSFTIDVAANGSAPVAKTMTGTVDQNNDTVTFGDFTYTEPGTYTYKVTETGTVKGVTNDKDAASGKTVTVTVKDNGDGTLTATADSTADKPIEFTNTYSVEPVKVDPPVKKNIDGNESLYNKGDFTFKIECTKMPAGVEKAPMPDKTEVKNVKADEHPEKKGYYEFGWITFTVPGEYIYTVTESGSAPGVTNDSEATKTLKFTVTDGGEGVLEITPTSDSAVFEFTNTYGTKGEFVPEVTKVLDGRTLKAGEFKFTLSDSDGKVIDTKTNAADGKVTFDALSFTGADDGKTYTYTITEVKGTDKDVVYDTHTVTLTVSVKDNGDGTMTATGTYNGDQKFINTIEVPDTGDHSQIALWTSTMCASLLGIVLLAVIKRRKPSKHSR